MLGKLHGIFYHFNGCMVHGCLAILIIALVAGAVIFFLANSC